MRRVDLTMRKRILAFLLACSMALLLSAAFAEQADPDEESHSFLRVGNPTPTTGKFFTTMWGGTTSDLDVQELLYAYEPGHYDIGTSRFVFDRSVVQDAIVTDDAEGNREYLIVLYDDLKYSDGTAITAWDYAFSILFRMDPAVAETGGKTADFSWIAGAEEYLDGTSPVLSGVHVIDDDMIQITAKAESLPYFYELNRLWIIPYPADEIAPGITVQDEGNGVFLSGKLTADMIRETVLDPEKGILSHPGKVSGPYVLDAYDGTTSYFSINPYFRGKENGYLPQIRKLEYTTADQTQMMGQLAAGEFGLLNKVTYLPDIQEGIRLRTETRRIDADNYMRSGLTMIWFAEGSRITDAVNIRKAIAYSFDREKFITDYVGPYGMQMDGFYGLGQWMFLQASGWGQGESDEEFQDEELNALEDAYAGINLDGLTIYSLDPAKASELLEEAGWKLNAEGKRTKEIDGETVPLLLTLGIPESGESEEGLRNTLLIHLWEIGVDVKVQKLSMPEIVQVYRGENDSVDLVYMGENFTLVFDPALLKTGKESGELVEMAQEMVRTEPADGAGFLRKWVELQERITETLPLIPVYSNVYFDFFSRELHDYEISRAVTWGEAITASRISDAEDNGEEHELITPEILMEKRNLIRNRWESDS